VLGIPKRPSLWWQQKNSQSRRCRPCQAQLKNVCTSYTREMYIKTKHTKSRARNYGCEPDLLQPGPSPKISKVYLVLLETLNWVLPRAKSTARFNGFGGSLQEQRVRNFFLRGATGSFGIWDQVRLVFRFLTYCDSVELRVVSLSPRDAAVFFPPSLEIFLVEVHSFSWE
jgi:hypothetical protein